MYEILQFSPTGNSAYVAKLIGEGLTSNIYPLEHTSQSTLKADTHLILVFSIHAFNAPRTVKRYVKALTSGKFKFVSLIAVGCNTSWVNSAATRDLRKVLEAKGYDIIVDTVVAMPLTLVTGFPDDLIQDQLKEIKTRCKEIVKDIDIGKKYSVTIPFKTHMIHSLGYIEDQAAKLFGLELHAKKTCIKCGLCIRECPEDNIKMNKNNKVKFGIKCMLCMRCIYNCPTRSITPWISKFIVIKGGYKLSDHLERSRNE